MKLLSAMLTTALLLEVSFVQPAFSQGDTTSSGSLNNGSMMMDTNSGLNSNLNSSGNTVIRRTTVVQPAVVQPATTTVVTSPAVIDRTNHGNNWLIPAVIAAGVATAIAVPVSLARGNRGGRGGRGRQAFLAQQQLLYFQRPTP
jgi:hypothetical protein